MIYELNGKIEGLTEQKTCILFGVSRQDASQFLFYLTALELGRLPAFRVSDQKAFIQFSYDGAVRFSLGVDEISLNGFFTKEQNELLKCCCADAVLDFSYDHIDFEHDLCDFTFFVCTT